MVEIKDGAATMPVDQYEHFLDRYMLLQSLLNGGVDNWCGWDDAREEYFAWKDGE